MYNSCTFHAQPMYVIPRPPAEVNEVNAEGLAGRSERSEGRGLALD